MARKIKNACPATTIVAIADDDLPEYRVASRRADIDYFVPKDQWSADKILALVETILLNDEPKTLYEDSP